MDIKPLFTVTLSFDADSAEEFVDNLEVLVEWAKITMLAGKDIAPLGPWAGGIDEGWFTIEVSL